MAASHRKRGEKNRVLDPVLARALTRLNQHMTDEGISQTDLAKKTGLKQGHVSKLLTGKSPEASFYLITKLALAAGVSLDYLVARAPAPARTPELSLTEASPPSTARLLSSNPPPSKTA
jgi:transcriptional regulator with XRE-family HTH domain